MKRNYSELISDIINTGNESAKELVELDRETYARNVVVETYNIVSDEQARHYGRERGRYTLLSIPNILYASNAMVKRVSRCFEKIMRTYVGNVDRSSKILVVGLGNRHISSDSLGTHVVSKMNVTINANSRPRLMAMCPSVMGLTGIESYDIVKGVVDEVKPSHLIIIDCLCAGDVDRLGTSIQISNTGLCPGSGIGNTRRCIDTSLAPNVISIGVPLLIYANTFLDSACMNSGITSGKISTIMQISKKSKQLSNFYEFAECVKKLYEIDYEDMIVSPKDVGEYVEILSDIISNGINNAVLN